jgi:hypothetical protein
MGCMVDWICMEVRMLRSYICEDRRASRDSTIMHASRLYTAQCCSDPSFLGSKIGEGQLRLAASDVAMHGCVLQFIPAGRPAGPPIMPLLHASRLISDGCMLAPVRCVPFPIDLRYYANCSSVHAFTLFF